jgi:hypothetical protein
MGWATIWGEFFTNSSGHPGSKKETVFTVQNICPRTQQLIKVTYIHTRKALKYLHT